jgi:hypothetical protein
MSTRRPCKLAKCTTLFKGREYPYLSLFSGVEEKDIFFDKLKIDELFIYSNGFSFNEVKEMAMRRGLIIKRSHYRQNKFFAYVTENEMLEKKIFHFNEGFLDI